jgi:hypothetical protein
VKSSSCALAFALSKFVKSACNKGGCVSENEKIPLLQKLYDKPFLLLALGIIVMLVFYTLWGLYEVATLPQATLP